MKQLQRLHRERDPRVPRSLAVALGGALLLVLAGLIVVGLRVQQVHLAYQLDAWRAERARLEVLIGQLDVEVATLRSPARIAARAQQLGLTAPGREQVRLAREYVTSTTGLAAAERNRVAELGTDAATSLGRTPRRP